MGNSVTDASKASSLEHDVLRSVLDHDAVPHVLKMAQTNWHVDLDTAWATLQHQHNLGRLSAYRQTDDVPVDLSNVTLESVKDDFFVIVEPTDETFKRLNELNLA